jgi:hypothetical protein
VAEKLKPISPGGIRIDFDSFTEPERQLFNRVWEIRDEYGSAPPAEVLDANRDFLLKAQQVVFVRVMELFMFVLRELLLDGEVEEWFLNLHAYNFFEDLSECLGNLRKWPVQDREQFLRGLKENGLLDRVCRIPRASSWLDRMKDEESEQEGKNLD